MTHTHWTRLIRDIPDFPKPGIVFKDIMPVLADAAAFDDAIEALAAPWLGVRIDAVLAMEARGFLLGAALARALGEHKAMPPVALRLIGSGEKSGQLAPMLEAAAVQQSREVRTNLAVLAAILGPVVILLVGAVVLAIVLAILLPIFELNSLVGRA